MPHRLSHLSAAALLTALLLLLVAAPAWAQGGDEPVSSDDPSAQGEEPTAEEGGEVSGASTDDARNGRNDVNCEEFQFQEEAQELFDRQGGREGGDEDRLDEDPGPDDGQACEDLPSRGDGGDTAGGDTDDDTPSGGVDSGFGPVAREPAGDAPPPIALVGTGLGVLALVALGLAVARTRRAG